MEYVHNDGEYFTFNKIRFEMAVWVSLCALIKVFFFKVNSLPNSSFNSPLLFDVADKTGVEWRWFSSTEMLVGESRVRHVWRGGSGSGGSVGLLEAQSRR